MATVGAIYKLSLGSLHAPTSCCTFTSPFHISASMRALQQQQQQQRDALSLSPSLPDVKRLRLILPPSSFRLKHQTVYCAKTKKANIVAAACILQSFLPSRVCCSSVPAGKGPLSGTDSILNVFRKENTLIRLYQTASYPLLHLGAVCRSGGRIISTGSLRGHGSREESGPVSRLGRCKRDTERGGERGMLCGTLYTEVAQSVFTYRLSRAKTDL